MAGTSGESAPALSPFAVDNPGDVDWAELPTDCVFSFHWHKTASFLAKLEQHGFHIIALARHPLDVLISILQFALYHGSSTSHWLEGEEGNERSIYGAMPCSQAFLEYSTSKRAAALLSVSREWWKAPIFHRIRYEDVVANPRGELSRVVDRFGLETKKSIEETIAEHTLSRMRTLTGVPHHFWQGRPGIWRELLPQEQANHIAAFHKEVFSDLGYECDPNLDLDRRRADSAWIELVGWDLADELQHMRRIRQKVSGLETQLAQLGAQHQAVQQQLITAHHSIGSLTAQLDRAAALETQLGAQHQAAQQQLIAAHHSIGSLTEQLDRTAASLAQFEQLGPLAIGVARRLRRTSLRFPRTSSLVKRFVRYAAQLRN